MLCILIYTVQINSQFAQPNYRFILSEMVELNSFPRKALTSIVHEAGPLPSAELRTSDVMLKGTWSRFVLQLFASTQSDYEWGSNLLLFLNVINGSLLLHSEDHSILRTCLSALLLAAVKFSGMFKRDGYQVVVPTLVHVYSLHSRNQLVTGALKFIWSQFYRLHENTYLLQVSVSAKRTSTCSSCIARLVTWATALYVAVQLFFNVYDRSPLPTIGNQ